MSFLIDHTPGFIKRTYFAPMMLAKLRERSYRKKYYSIDPQLNGDNVKQAVIFMIDGRFIHGGLSDRIWGAISSYQVCKKRGLDFKINWTYPFRLSTFLEPATIDWRIDPKEVVYDPRFATPLFVNNNHNVNNQWRLLERIAHTGKKQVHVYSPSHIDRENFSKNFAELFKPSPLLAENINKQKEAIGEDYISIT
ncbi:MAG: hypothetical protein K2H61_01805, partial [Muribaculaceae bacterium]|nr:hypothetical protein [Muribaculaceae bacterium]